MSTRRSPAQSGLTIIELLVSLAVFSMFVLMIDAVFSGANRTSRKAEVAADVQQNARVAADRLTREIRESSALPGNVACTPGPCSDAGNAGILFKSARLHEDNTVFCVYVRNTTDPDYMWKLPGTSAANAECFRGPPGPELTPPPYSPPAGLQGTYTPIWQRYIGYYTVVDSSTGLLELRRVVGHLSTPGDVLNLAWLTGGTPVASLVESFGVTLTGATFSLALKAKGIEIVQGSDLPAQEVRLPGGALLRN
jgi:prepilin-type N-terminal cleavage/methylation domain-containing protein